MSSSRKSLIVGAAGQVGHQLVLALGEDKVLRAGRSACPGWAEIDLATLSRDDEPARRILGEHDLAAVFCAGGATDVERCETEPGWAEETNHRGPAKLASLCSHLPFIYYSTEYVFDGLSGPYPENAPVHPICVYGESKARGERDIVAAHPAPLILRTTVVYGEDPGAKNFLYTLRRLLTAGTPMRVPADQISTPTYNRDLARASALLVELALTGTFHVCGPDLLDRYEFAVRCARIMGLDERLITGVPTSSLNQKAARPLNAGMLTQKLEEALPEFRMRGLEAGVRDWLARGG